VTVYTTTALVGSNMDRSSRFSSLIRELGTGVSPDYGQVDGRWDQWKILCSGSSSTIWMLHTN